MANDASIDAIKSQPFFNEFYSAIEKLTIGEYLFASKDDGVRALAKHAKEHWLPFLSSTQIVKIKAKDTTLCESTGRDDSNVSKLSMMRYFMTPETTTAMKENEENQNRDCLFGTMCNTEVLTKT